MRLRTSLALGLSLAVAALLASAPLRANIVVNGGFETGDFTGWTQFGDTSFSGVDGLSPFAGTYAAFFGPAETGGISQTLATAAGTVYHIEFWLKNEVDANGDDTPNLFQMNWDGVAVAQIMLTDASIPGYTLFGINLAATGALTDLSFAFTNVPAFWDLDNVSVTTVPEPGTLALLALAGTMLGFGRRRRVA